MSVPLRCSKQVQVGVEDLQHPGRQVPALLLRVGLGGDVLAAHDEVVGKASSQTAGPGQAEGADIGQEAAGVAAGLHPHVGTDRAGALVMSQPVGEGDDVAAAEGRRVLTVVWAGLAQARRQLADDTDNVPGDLGCLAAAVLRQFLPGPPLGGLPQPGLADGREVEPPRQAQHGQVPHVLAPLFIGRGRRPLHREHKLAAQGRRIKAGLLDQRAVQASQGCRLGPAEHRHHRAQRRDQGPDARVGAQLQAQQQLQLHPVGQPFEDHEVVGVDWLGDPRPPAEVRSRVLPQDRVPPGAAFLGPGRPFPPFGLRRQVLPARCRRLVPGL